MLKNNYQGIDQLDDDTDTALTLLSTSLTIVSSQCETHSCMLMQDFEDESVLEAAAVYLVAAISQSIEGNLQIRKALFDEATATRDLLFDIKSVIGENNAVEETFLTKVRDPWIWEGLSHMFVHLSRYDASFFTVGALLATSGIKHDVHDHGLDLVGIYDSGEMGIIAGESKAYSKRPASAIKDAANKLGEIDRNERDTDIRATISQLRSGLSEADQERLAGAFWRQERCYIPFVCCDQSAELEWSSKRSTMRKLNIPVSQKIIMPLCLTTVRSRFDRIADLMREYPTI